MGFKLDISKMKFHKSDKNSTTFQHPSGHLITIAHASLAPENKSALADVIKNHAPKKFAEGDKVAAPSQQQAKPPPAPIKNNEFDNAGGWNGVVNNAKKALGFAEGGMPDNKPPQQDNSPNKKMKEMKEGAEKSGGAPSDSPLKTGDWSHVWKASGGEVKMAEGGEAAYDANLPCLNPNCKSNGKPHPNCRCYGMAEGGEVSNRLRYCAYGKPHQNGCEYGKMAEGGNAMPTMYARGGTPKPIPGGGIAPQAADDYAQQDADVDKEVNDNENYAQQLNAPGANPNFNSVTGQMQQPQAQPQPQQQAQPLQAPPDQPQQAPVQDAAPEPQKVHDSMSLPQPGQNQAQHANEVYNQLNQEAMDTADDFATGHINQKTYGDLMYHNNDGKPGEQGTEKTLGGKLGSIFGLLMSGAGSGLAHQQNMALHMMDKAIDTDLEAQKNTRSNQLNLLGHARDFMKTKSDIALQGADIGLRNQQAAAAKLNNEILAQTIYKNYRMLEFVNGLNGMNNNLPPGPNKAAAGQATAAVVNGVRQKIAQNNAQAAQVAAANAAPPPGSEQDYNATTQKWRGMGMLGMEGANDQVDYREGHMIPGVGTTTKPVSPADQDRVMKINNFQNLLHEAKNLSESQRIGPLTPAQSARAKAIESDLVSSYNDVKGLNRFTKNEEALYENVVPHLSSNKAALTGARKASLDRLIDSVQQKKDLEYSNLGIKPFAQGQSQSESGSAGELERLDPKSGKTVIYDAKTKKPLRWK